MPDPYVRLSFAIIGESHGVGVGTGALGGPGFAAGVAGAAAAGFGGVGDAGGEPGFSEGDFGLA
jgi:hypothetical protein